MDCPNCKTQLDKLKKYCPVCGTPLGVLCNRCGSTNGNNDNYCGNCGLPMLDTENSTYHHGHPHIDLPRQYDAEEILTLLSLRMVAEEEKDSALSYSQDDIDNLFP